MRCDSDCVKGSKEGGPQVEMGCKATVEQKL